RPPQAVQCGQPGPPVPARRERALVVAHPPEQPALSGAYSRGSLTALAVWLKRNRLRLVTRAAGRPENPPPQGGSSVTAIRQEGSHAPDPVMYRGRSRARSRQLSRSQFTHRGPHADLRSVSR